MPNLMRRLLFTQGYPHRALFRVCRNVVRSSLGYPLDGRLVYTFTASQWYYPLYPLWANFNDFTSIISSQLLLAAHGANTIQVWCHANKIKRLWLQSVFCSIGIMVQKWRTNWQNHQEVMNLTVFLNDSKWLRNCRTFKQWAKLGQVIEKKKEIQKNLRLYKERGREAMPSERSDDALTILGY